MKQKWYNHEEDFVERRFIMAKRSNFTAARVLYSIMFLVLAILLPFLTARIPVYGASLLPMGFAVMLCGFICGPTFGMIVGAAAPFLYSFLFGAVSLPGDLITAVELATYAFVAGLLYGKLEKNLFMYFVDLITSMVCGRLIWGALMFIFIFLDMIGGEIGISLIWNNKVMSCLPGIVLQLVAIPLIVNVLRKNRLMLN